MYCKMNVSGSRWSCLCIVEWMFVVVGGVACVLYNGLFVVVGGGACVLYNGLSLVVGGDACVL